MLDYDMKQVEKDDILVCVWGWEQTNVDFFQVVKTTAKSFWIRPISKKSVETPAKMEDYVVPEKDSFLSEQFCDTIYGKSTIRKVKKGYVEMGRSRGPIRKYNGKPILETSYY